MNHPHTRLNVRAGARTAAASAAVAGALVAASIGAMAGAQSTPPPNGPRSVEPAWHAIVNATLVPAPGELVEDATIVLRDGVIRSIATGAEPPAGARVWDATGMTVYAGFIDAHVPVDAPTPGAGSAGVHWSDKVVAQRSALDGDGLSAGDRESLRSLGFTVAAIAPDDGVFRGQGAVVSLRSATSRAPDVRSLFSGFGGGGNNARQSEPAGPFEETVIKSPVFHEVALETGGFGGGYPTSNMGAVALVRQTLSDADWHDRARIVHERNQQSPAPEPAAYLDALGPGGSAGLPLLFNTDNELEALWLHDVATEFDRPAMIVGSGTEFRRLDAIASTGMPIILPLNYPDAPNVSTAADAEQVELRTLMTWEQAPTNARRLADARVTIALTTDRLESRKDFLPNLRKAVEHGFAKDAALAALTTTPARLFGLEQRVGRVEPGFVANLVVVDGDLFDKDAKIRDVWVDGERYEITPPDAMDITGRWAVDWDGTDNEAFFDVAKGPAITVRHGDAEAKAEKVALRDNRLTFQVQGEALGFEGVWLASAVIDEGRMLGFTVSPAGESRPFGAERPGDVPEQEEAEGEGQRGRRAQAENAEDAGDADAEGEEAEVAGADVPEALPVPFGAYGFLEQPAQEDVVVTNATIWTAGDAGIIEDGAMVVRAGTIEWVGEASDLPRSAGDLRVIDAQGKHVTPGLFDAHSHTGIGNSFGDVNEVGQTVTAEARVRDIINPDDVNWYRQLAGGLTAANQLHGSANPIGGQSNVVKLRWGVSAPKAMVVTTAPEGIKFALGENPKRNSWRYEGESRYPQSRIGLFTIIRERFVAAQDYIDAQERYDAMSAREKEGVLQPRRDLELEALAEILRGERFIHCHSYRQDESFGLTRIADEFGFTIGTFQHVLEGYKVAEAIKAHAIGASAFSDWWAFKFEVYDAIPYNGAIMHEVGVPVTFNSDSSELARRMNLEAAKAVKYGGVEPNEALKFVTYNAALQFQVEDRMGSLEAGKDADFVIWTGSPFSTMSRAESTWIEGREMFSIEKDRALRERDAAERQRLIQKVLAQGGGGSGAGPRRPGRMGEFTEEQALLEAILLELARDGKDINHCDIGECGLLTVGHQH
ncbi:MAG: amidohydrolase family protein [Phycisphaerales bacterium]